MKKKLLVLIGILAMAFGVNMYAGTTYENYSTTVGKFNGSGYTGYQIKDTTGAAATLRSGNVGQSYYVDCRMIDDSGNTGDWERNITDSKTYSIDGDSKHVTGDEVRLEFSNDFTTSVDVQVSGSWKSN